MTDPLPRARMVESLPLDLEHLRDPAVPATASALTGLIQAATRTIDISAMYWTLRPDPAQADTRQWTTDELVQQFGAGEGERVFHALREAASRDVRVRVVQSSGFEGDPGGTEPEQLAAEFPRQVEVRSVHLDAWFGHGIMHQKILIIDGAAFYVGSANMDWRSFTQVKELGVIVEGEPGIVGDVGSYFETWWDFAARSPNDGLPMPSDLQPDAVPAGRQPGSSWDAPLLATLDGVDGFALVSGSPRALCTPPRSEDLDVLVATIDDAMRSVCVNVMDFAPISIYSRRDAGQRLPAVWWPDLTDAILRAAVTRGVACRLLVSEWAHTSAYVGPLLAALRTTAEAAGIDTRVPTGILDIRRFRVPGWQETLVDEDRPAAFPGHTRVNHVKFIVTERRANIGTSNMTWDYFEGTAGTSVNVTHDHLIHCVQRLFDRDWHSPYASPLPGPPPPHPPGSTPLGATAGWPT